MNSVKVGQLLIKQLKSPSSKSDHWKIEWINRFV